MKLISYKSDGLGGFFGVSNSLKLGTTIRLTYNKLQIVLFLIIISGLTSPTSSITNLLSLIIALQRSNEAYKNIKPRTCRKLNLTQTALCLSNLVIFIIISKLLFWMYHLLLLSGDVEINPGPKSIDNLNDSSDSSSDILSQALTCHLSIFHMNIQSIVPKMELIKADADTYDILIFTESWLKPSTPDTSIRIDNYVGPFRTDRPDCQGGGVVAYVRETIACRRRPDLEVRGLEALWLEIEINSKNVLVGGFYRAPGSDAAYFDLLKESVDRAYNTNTEDIIITGDFNFNMMSKNMNKL